MEPGTNDALTLSNPAPSLITIAHVVYALHAVSLGIGAFTPAAVVLQFLFGWPSLIGVILNYVYRSDTKGTWLESHFRWQIRTFWFALIAISIVGFVSMPLVLALGLGILTWFAGLFVVGLWAIIRIARGWLRLRDAKPAPL